MIVILELIGGEIIVKGLLEKIDMKGKDVLTATPKGKIDIQGMIEIGSVTERGTETEGLIGIETTIEESGEKEEDEIDHQGRGAIDLDHLTDGIVIGIEHQTGKLFEPDCI